jgi:hypothetical protein
MGMVLIIAEDTALSQVYSLNLHVHLGIDSVVKGDIPAALKFLDLKIPVHLILMQESLLMRDSLDVEFLEL